MKKDIFILLDDMIESINELKKMVMKVEKK